MPVSEAPCTAPSVTTAGHRHHWDLEDTSQADRRDKRPAHQRRMLRAEWQPTAALLADVASPPRNPSARSQSDTFPVTCFSTPAGRTLIGQCSEAVSVNCLISPAHEHGGIAVWLKAFRRVLRHPARSPFSVGIPELGPWTGFLRAAPTMNGARLIWYILRMTMGME